MKLEYFEDGYRGEDVLLLYSGTVGEVEHLRATFRELLRSGTMLGLHELAFLKPIDGCRVTCCSVPLGRGVRALGEARSFVWEMAPSDWDQAEGLLEPFCETLPVGAGTRFQYLHELGGTEVIYSTTRTW